MRDWETEGERANGNANAWRLHAEAWALGIGFALILLTGVWSTL